MGDQVGNSKQPFDQDPGRLHAEHVHLLAAAVSLTLYAGIYAVDQLHPVDVNRGVYAFLAAAIVTTGCGWLVRSAERRVRQELSRDVGQLTTALEELRDQVAQHQQVTYLPPQRHEGRRCVTAAGSQQAAVPQQRTGMDADSIEAARRISLRLANGNDKT